MNIEQPSIGAIATTSSSNLITLMEKSLEALESRYNQASRIEEKNFHFFKQFVPQNHKDIIDVNY